MVAAEPERFCRLSLMERLRATICCSTGIVLDRWANFNLSNVEKYYIRIYLSSVLGRPLGKTEVLNFWQLRIDGVLELNREPAWKTATTQV
jgi:hypothetical protein